MSLTDSPPCIIPFPSRRARAVFLCPAVEGGWFVLAGAHGWLHGDQKHAIDDARWLARNFGFPIRDGGDV
jgi:hypothetical protein